MTKLTVWAHKTPFGISWASTGADDATDLTKHGWVYVEDVEIKASTEEALELINRNAEEIKEQKRAKLLKELEALDNE